MTHVISIDTAAVMTATSKRTLWRRLSSGQLQRQGTDERGRVMLALADISPKFCITSDNSFELTTLITQADQGSAEAQNTLGLLCLEQGKAELAAYWLTLAAQQQHADAMHLLSGLYYQGKAVERCENSAMMWLAKAANLGHCIARAQMHTITGAR